MQAYRLELKTVTPVVIGSGQELESFDYIIYKNKGSASLFAFDLMGFALILNKSQREDFLIKMEGDVIELRELLEKYSHIIVANKNIQRFKFGVKNNVALMYRQKIGAISNQMTIGLFPRSSGAPYIPGSSLKGAFRTAVAGSLALNTRDFEKNIIDSLKKKSGRMLNDRQLKSEIARNLEKYIFGYKSPNDDPFRTFKIADTQPIETEAVLTERCSFKVGKEKERIPALREAAIPKTSTASILTIVDEFAGKKGAPKASFNINKLAANCRQFYGKVLNTEVALIEGKHNPYINIDLSWIKTVEDAAEGRLGETCFPLRVGWGAGKPANTIILATNEKRPVSKSLVNKGDEHVPLGWMLARLEAL